jgi:cAMP-dependent protein kinase regulator
LINRGRRRSSVSAEKINISLLATSEVKCFPKTNEEATRIQYILSTVEHILFKVLDKAQIIAIQNAMFLVENAEGDVIIKQGDEGDNFYIIDSGTVSAFVQRTVSTNPPGELVRQYGEGDSFGELAILYNAPRAATCVATSPVVRLWALDRVSFKQILVKNSLAKQTEYTGFLKQVPIFAQLTECELLTVADALEEKVFSENEIVCAQGDVGDSFYVIVEGIAVCAIKDGSGNVNEVARLSRGSYFGEVSCYTCCKFLVPVVSLSFRLKRTSYTTYCLVHLVLNQIALITSKTRQATVTSLDHLKCLTVDRKTFQRVMGPLTNFLMRNMEEYIKIQAGNI